MLLYQFPFWLLVGLPAVAASAVLLGLSARRLLTPAAGRRGLFWMPGLVLAMIWQTPLWSGDENVLIILVVLLAAFLLAFDGPPLARMVVGVMLFLCLAPCKMLVDTLGVEAPLVQLVGGVPLAVALYAGVRLLTRGQPAPPRLPVRMWALLALLCVTPLVSVAGFSIWGIIPERRVRGLVYTTLPLACLSGLSLLVALTVLARQQRLEEAQRLADQRESYYQHIRREQTALRTLQHDLRNHLSALQGLLAQGLTARAQEYLQQLTQSPALQGSRRFCENEAANAVLASKQAQLSAQGLTADFQVTLPTCLPVADADLCALLGNALDNAAEAAAKAEDKTVRLRATAAKGLLMLRVQNAYAGPRAAGLTTTKPDADRHGLGLTAMRAIAARYHGALSAQAENGRFELVVSLTLNAEAQKGV